ncbi:tRNA-nucleotidyltransferase 1 [Roseibium sp. TrichSKD4]|uniref:CCA tRNA nucleotidyltransferase n=1 Tax=Roseibium sp. TrichSKD4 TaxID=744980 RepID=UPI0001E5680B|nr:CCA tRNA nucleotidyltransferase [Roseibium sp. TrichSKD4]EFO31724.1 tRNA-nucleotidyltransferase 1 [Roseibium sp. TrichSKD4]
MADTPAQIDLSGQDWLHANGLQRLFDALEKAGAEARAVGGAVRNSLVSVPVVDVDIATTARPEDVIAAVNAAGLKPIPTGVDHGTVTVLSEGEAYEVTTLRRDVETFGRQAKVVFGSDWIEDAKRRDFTLNAIYADRAGTLFDPLGGVPDCLAGRVRFIGNPEGRIREDYLRILRFFRIHATYGKGKLDPEGLAACARLQEGLQTLSSERIGAEMKRLLPASGGSSVVPEMAQKGILHQVLLQDADTDVYCRLHGYAAIRNTPIPFTTYLVALIGLSESTLRKVAERLRLSNRELDHMLSVAKAAETQSTSNPPIDPRLQLYHFGAVASLQAAFLSFSAHEHVSSADGLSDCQEAFLSALENEELPVFPIQGKDLISAGMAPGPEIGAALKKLENIWIAGGLKQGRSELLKLAVTT